MLIAIGPRSDSINLTSQVSGHIRVLIDYRRLNSVEAVQRGDVALVGQAHCKLCLNTPGRTVQCRFHARHVVSDVTIDAILDVQHFMSRWLLVPKPIDDALNSIVR